MVHTCIECGKIVDGTRIYCKKCEEKVKEKIEKRKNFKAVYEKSDFFQRQRLK